MSKVIYFRKFIGWIFDDTTLDEKRHKKGFPSRQLLHGSAQHHRRQFDFWWVPEMNFIKLLRTGIEWSQLWQGRVRPETTIFDIFYHVAWDYTLETSPIVKKKSRFIVGPMFSFEKVSSPFSSNHWHQVWTCSCSSSFPPTSFLRLSTPVVTLSIFGWLSNWPPTMESSSFVSVFNRVPRWPVPRLSVSR